MYGTEGEKELFEKSVLFEKPAFLSCKDIFQVPSKTASVYEEAKAIDFVESTSEPCSSVVPSIACSDCSNDGKADASVVISFTSEDGRRSILWFVRGD